MVYSFPDTKVVQVGFVSWSSHQNIIHRPCAIQKYFTRTIFVRIIFKHKIFHIYVCVCICVCAYVCVCVLCVYVQ